MDYKIVKPKIQYNKNDSIVDKILKIRGIDNKEEFINPTRNNLNSCWELSNMDKASERIIKAIQNKERIAIHGDIDCDGVTSLVIMYKYLKDYDIVADIIYHQRGEGHGVKIEEVSSDIDLLIIVDSSTNSIDECKEISKNTDIVILDHHEQDKINPYAIIVNPQINNYSNKFLSGAGVVFKTCEAMDEILGNDFIWKYLDICAVGLCGDMMNVTNLETRYLIQHGLYKMGNKDKCDFNLLLILKQLKKDFRPNSTTISFYIAPFINSIIRLNKIENIINIFILEDEKEIKKLLKECSKLNEKRKEVQKNIVNKINKDIDLSHSIIIYKLDMDDNTKALSGLVANNIMNTYHKPTFIISKDMKSNIYKGSCRNCCDLDIRGILNEKGIGLGEGHKGSFGIKIEEENISKLYDIFDKLIKREHLTLESIVDLELNQSEISFKELQELEKLTFVVGQGFKEPQFLIKYLFKTDSKIMKDIHVKLTAGEFDCVKFNLEEEEVDRLINSFCFDVIGGLAINSWYNFKTKQLTKTKQILISDINVY